MTGRPKDPKTARNKNVLVIGGSGSGKTRFYVKPNLMQCFPTSDYPTSFVVTDPKGTLVLETGQMFQRAGYRVKILNTINFSKSMKYNPFVYIHSEKDVLKLVNTLIANTKGEGEKSAEDFWVKSERLFYTALIGYIWYEAPAEEMNFTTLLEMINASEAREDDPEFQSPVDLMFERLEQKDPDHFAVRQYKKFLLSAGKTRSSILISCGARLAPFDIREVRELMEDDEMELDTIGDEKTVLFLIMSDTDTTFNFILAMLQSQLINLLCDRADDKYGGQLPVHVRLILDEFANIGQIPNFDKLIATIRSREISAFTQYGYLVKSGDEWQKVYEDQPVPEEYRVLSFPASEILRDAANIPPPVQSTTEQQKVIPIILNGKDSTERMKEITDRLETGIQELFDSDRYKAYLTTMAKFHNYSFNNTLLIAMQGGQLVAGFNKWKDTFHRTVKKGEKGIKILAPAPYKVKQKMEKLDEQGKPILDKDGKPLTEEKTVQIPAFKVVSVFDVSQTEGEPLPTIAVNELSGSVQDYQDFFKALEQASPVPIGFEGIEGGAHGYFHLLDNRIAIQEGMSQLQTIKTAIHEIAHAKLHAIDPDDPEQTNRPDSRTREVQAESVAYAVCQHYGLDTSEYSFGYVAGWSSGRELAELKASLEIIRSAAHELISAPDEHLAELRQQRETELSTAQEAAFALDNGNTLFIQTCDSGYDYTLYGPDNKALDGGQLDAPGLTLPDAGQEALNLLGQTAAVSEVLLGDKLAAFQEAAEKANEIPAPVKIPDPAAEPTVTILWSESDKLQDGEIMPLSVANRVFEELDTAQHTEREKDGYTGGWYDKTAFRIDFTLNGQPDNYEGRQDFGDGDVSLIQHIQNYHEYYAKDENWKNFVLHNKGPEAWEQDKAEREMVLTEFIPYLKQHCNLSAMEQTATTALREGQNILPEQTAYYNAIVTYVQDCRPLLNQGQYGLAGTAQAG